MYIRVKVTPGAKKEAIEQRFETEFAIMVREPAERNLANKRVIELIARWFKIQTNAVTIVSGHRSRTKVCTVET